MQNYYHATCKVDFSPATLTADTSADVAVIGGGITGTSAALHLAERGYKVALLEAQQVGWGASGRNGGQALPGFGCSIHKLRQLTDAPTVQRLWDMSVEAVELLHSQIARFDIPANPVRGYLHAALKERQVHDLREEQEELAALGAPVGRLFTGDDLRAKIASPRYLAALEDNLSGHIQPYNYTLGLAKAAQAAGAQIYAGAPVQKVEPGPRITLHVGKHRVTASHLLVAAGAYLNGLEQKLAGYIMPVGTYVMATEPRDDVAALIPGNEAVADLNFVLDYFRRSPDNRMLFGGRVSYSTLPPPSLGASMLRRAVRVFPQLKNAKVEYLWGGNVDITVNRAPHFGRLADNILFAHGFSGHGVALTGLAGKLAAETIAGQAERFDVFTRIPHARFPGGPALRTPALLLATSWFRLRDLL